VVVAIVEGAVTTNRWMTSDIVYREVLESFKYINKCLLIKHFIVSTCELLAGVQVLLAGVQVLVAGVQVLLAGVQLLLAGVQLVTE
jgi:hypothetical protein